MFTATLSAASHGVTTIHTDQGDITIADGATTGTLVIASGNGEDVYTDASSLTASITGVSGGGFESLVVGSGTATADVTDTATDVTVDLTASTVDEGAGADYVFTATLSAASHGVTTIHTDQGDITIADGATTGTLVIASGNGEDVYTDASSLTASITGVSGGGFEQPRRRQRHGDRHRHRHRHRRHRRPHRLDASMKAPAPTTCSPPRCRPLRTASPPSTPTRATSPSPTAPRPARWSSPRATARTSTPTPPSLTASITGVSGGGFESLVVGSGTATAAVTDTATDVTVDLTASTVNEGAGADYVFTATLSAASHGVTTIHTDQGDIYHRRRRHDRHAGHRLGQRRGRLHRRLHR